MTHLTLNNSQKMPVLGLGTWRSKPNEVGAAVTHALTKSNYTHIDCASIYRNEPEIGKAFSVVFSGKKIKREDIFATSKLWNTDHHPDHVEQACRQTLKDLQLDYLDLYLMHWGIAFEHGNDLEPLDSHDRVKTAQVQIHETWEAMEALVEKGLVKSIGVANFTTMMLVDLLAGAKIPPAVNQIELHPLHSQQALVDYCQREGIVVTAYSPLGSPGNFPDVEKLMTNKVVKGIAKKHKKSPAQVLIRWAIQRDTVVIPKSITPKRIDENADVFDFKLSQKEMDDIAKLNKDQRILDPISWWGVPYFD